jgi:isocitrate dehydrogenase
LEAASRETIECGVMTKDLTGLSEGVPVTAVSSQAFLNAIRERLAGKL